MNYRHLLTLLTSCLLLLGCEAPYVGEPLVEEEENANVVLQVSGFQVIPFDDGTSASMNPSSRADQPITDLCSRLTFVAYQGENQMRKMTQKQGDKDFGTVAFALPAGKYTFAIIGYNGESCSIKSLDKITLSGLKDTFLYCEELEVTDQKTTHDVKLKRVVAKIRFTLTDEVIPDDVRQLQFTYTGGCTTMSALTSYGSVTSGTQSAKLEVTTGQRQFEVYTIPRAETGTLKMTVTALDASGNTVKERVFEDVPVRRNAITAYTGNFFEGAAESSELSFGMSADGEWEDGDEVAF